MPALAARAGCPVFGSASLTQLMKPHGRADLAVAVEPHRPHEIGPFTVTFAPSRHSRLAAGLWTPSDGELSCEHTDRADTVGIPVRQVWGIHVEVAGATFYHQGSCDLVDEYVRALARAVLCEAELEGDGRDRVAAGIERHTLPARIVSAGASAGGHRRRGRGRPRRRARGL